MHNQINNFFINKLSKYQSAFRKGLGTQHCLLVMIEKLREIQVNKRFFAAVFIDLSETFDCISHELLITKLNAYRFDIESLNFILACFTDRKQKTKVGYSFSNFLNIFFGVPQGSILFPLLFIIYIRDLFIEYEVIEFAGYPDDTTPYTYGQSFDEIIEKLETDMSNICELFHHNGLKSIQENFLLSPFLDRTIKIMRSTIKTSNEEVLLGMRTDSDVTFEEHVTSICYNANQIRHTLTKVSKQMSLQKDRISMKSFITSHCNYFPMIWMYHSRSLNNKVNHIHERALRIVYQDFQSSVLPFLVKDHSLTIHQKSLQLLAIET